VGLAGGKRVVIASSRGGRYVGTPLEVALDHQEAYLRGMFGFVRIADQTIVRAEGTNLAPEAVQLAMTSAQKQIDQRFATWKAA
jgi:FMN-dependent NADH-azoreductase